jgi:phage-related minor tail protein
MSQSAPISKSYVEVLPTINGISSQLRQQLTAVATHAANTLGDGFRQAAVSGVNDINQAMGNINIPTQAMNQQLQQVANNGAQSLQAALAGVNIPAAPITAATSQGASAGMQGGMVSGLRAAGPKILAGIAALGLGAAVGKAISTGLEIETGGAKTKASLGLTAGQSEQASQAGRNLYRGNYGDSLDGVQEAVTNAISSFSTLRNSSSADIEAITKKALNMNAVFELDTARVTQVASQMITTGFAKDGSQAMDMLSAAMQRVPANLREDVIDAMDEYGPFFQQLGLQGEKGMQLLINASAKNAYGIDKTGDALKEWTLLSKNMSSSAGESYKTLGMNQQDMANKIAAGGETTAKAFQQVVDGLLKIDDPLKQEQAAIGLFGVPLEDLGTNDIPKFLASLQTIPGGMGDISAAAAQMDADLGNTAAGSLESFKRNLEVTFGEAAIPLVKELQPMLSQATAWISANKDEIQTWIRELAGAIGAVLVPAYQFLMPIISGVTTFLNENKESIRQMMPVIITLGAVIGGLVLIGNVVAPIAALVGMLYTSVPAFLAAAGGASAFGVSLLPLIAVGAVIFAVGYAIGTFLYGLATDFDGTMKYLGESMAGIGWLMLTIGAIVANALIGIVNLVPIAINAMLNGINGLTGLIGIPPIGLLPMIPFIPLPTMATGGDIMGPTALVAGEKDPETIVDRGKMNTLMDQVISGKIGGGNGSDAPNVEVNITIQKGVADNDESLAEQVKVATQAAAGAAWKQKRVG